MKYLLVSVLRPAINAKLNLEKLYKVNFVILILQIRKNRVKYSVEVMQIVSGGAKI